MALSAFFRSVFIVGTVLALANLHPEFALAAEPQEPCADTTLVKVEGYISKEFKKDQKAIFKEFEEGGNTRVDLRVFPMGETAKVVAVGRCVPAPVARHVLAKALKYTGGIGALVQQQFVSPYWLGVGATIFDEPSQHKVTEEQVRQLLNESLSSEEFHVLYRKLSVPNDQVHYFGVDVPNAKRGN